MYLYVYVFKKHKINMHSQTVLSLSALFVIIYS